MHTKEMVDGEPHFPLLDNWRGVVTADAVMDSANLDTFEVLSRAHRTDLLLYPWIPRSPLIFDRSEGPYSKGTRNFHQVISETEGYSFIADDINTAICDDQRLRVFQLEVMRRLMTAELGVADNRRLFAAYKTHEQARRDYDAIHHPTALFDEYRMEQIGRVIFEGLDDPSRFGDERIIDYFVSEVSRNLLRHYPRPFGHFDSDPYGPVTEEIVGASLSSRGLMAASEAFLNDINAGISTGRTGYPKLLLLDPRLHQPTGTKLRAYDKPTHIEVPELLMELGYWNEDSLVRLSEATPIGVRTAEIRFYLLFKRLAEILHPDSPIDPWTKRPDIIKDYIPRNQRNAYGRNYAFIHPDALAPYIFGNEKLPKGISGRDISYFRGLIRETCQ